MSRRKNRLPCEMKNDERHRQTGIVTAAPFEQVDASTCSTAYQTITEASSQCE